MKPRINVSDEVWRKTRMTAFATGRTISQVAEDALVNYLESRKLGLSTNEMSADDIAFTSRIADDKPDPAVEYLLKTGQVTQGFRQFSPAPKPTRKKRG